MVVSLERISRKQSEDAWANAGNFLNPEGSAIELVHIALKTEPMVDLAKFHRMINMNKEKKALSCQEILKNAGINFEEKVFGTKIVVTRTFSTISFYTSTRMYFEKDMGSESTRLKGSGIHNLIKYLKK